MMVKKQRNQLIYASGKKAQVGSIDSSIAYFLFAVFIIFVSQYVIGLGQPFETQLRNEILEKQGAELNNYFLKDSYTLNGFNDVCSSNINDVLGIMASYEIMGVSMPGWDEEVVMDELSFKRENNRLLINVSSNSDGPDIIELIIPKSVGFSTNTISTETTDSWTSTRTRKNNYLLTINSTTTGGDYDIYELVLDNQDSCIVFFNNISVPKTSSYIGTTRITGSCGVERNLVKKTYHTRTCLFEGLPARIGVDVWWQ